MIIDFNARIFTYSHIFAFLWWKKSVQMFFFFRNMLFYNFIYILVRLIF